jgi:hypothetical protein|nr:MAG TPA: hypothetical protein [Caudoviricetes sp.]
MKEMVYKPERCDPEQLMHGTWRGFDYYVLSLGTHPCAYVDISEYEGKPLNVEKIDCHGGITYLEQYLATVDRKGLFIGWDYSQRRDYNGACCDSAYTKELKRWTTAEMVAECKRVIDQICERRSDDG